MIRRQKEIFVVAIIGRLFCFFRRAANDRPYRCPIRDVESTVLYEMD